LQDRRNFEHPQDKQSCGSKNVSVSPTEDASYRVPKIRSGAGATAGAKVESTSFNHVDYQPYRPAALVLVPFLDQLAFGVWVHNRCFYIGDHVQIAVRLDRCLNRPLNPPSKQKARELITLLVELQKLFSGYPTTRSYGVAWLVHSH
jgi:hypothetical protein